MQVSRCQRENKKKKEKRLAPPWPTSNVLVRLEVMRTMRASDGEAPALRSSFTLSPDF